MTTGLVALITALCMALLTAASALAFGQKINKEDFKRFVNCPTASVNECTYGETLSGGFKMGMKSTSITNPVILQAGIANFSLDGAEPLPFTAPLFGAEAMSKTSQPIPGGLTGTTELLGGPASATSELAGPVSGITVAPFRVDSREGTAVTLPIKIHLENENLGPNCYIGSDEEPVVLHLTDGVTEPPEGTEPIEGKKGTIEGVDKGHLVIFTNNTLVDNTFPVPAAKDCGTSPLDELVITEAVNKAIGLPSPAGKNSAELTGNLYNATASYVAKYDKKEVKAKEKAEKPKK